MYILVPFIQSICYIHSLRIKRVDERKEKKMPQTKSNMQLKWKRLFLLYDGVSLNDVTNVLEPAKSQQIHHQPSKRESNRMRNVFVWMLEIGFKQILSVYVRAFIHFLAKKKSYENAFSKHVQDLMFDYFHTVKLICVSNKQINNLIFLLANAEEKHWNDSEIIHVKTWRIHRYFASFFNTYT